ncbi:MAG: cytochrome-c oxidase [Synechococcus sp.]
MLIIEVTNARDVVRQRIGRLGERLIGRVVDPEAQVEKALIQELETAFREFGIEARIVSAQGPQLIGRQRLELPIQVREDRDVRITDA